MLNRIASYAQKNEYSLTAGPTLIFKVKLFTGIYFDMNQI